MGTHELLIDTKITSKKEAILFLIRHSFLMEEEIKEIFDELVSSQGYRADNTINDYVYHYEELLEVVQSSDNMKIHKVLKKLK